MGKSGIKVSAIGLGTWQWGSREWGWNRLYTEKDVLSAFQSGLELGINFIDTAEIYGYGKSERIVGKAIHECREDVVIGSKVWIWNVSYGRLLRAADRSLQRLGVDVIDLYQIHWPNRFVPIAKTMKAMKKLTKDGKIRCVGVSNFNTDQMAAAQVALAPFELASNQVEYNLLDREIEQKLLPTARIEKISIIAYSPLAKGLLTGKYAAGSKPSSIVQKTNLRFSQTNLTNLAELQQLILKIGETHGKTPSQVVLNWLISKDVVIAIPGAKRTSNVIDNAGASDWRLTQADIDQLQEVANRINFDKRSLLVHLIRGLRPL